MGRYDLRLRPIYDEGELTGPEQLSQGIGRFLGDYAQRQEVGRQERNRIQDAGGTILPDDPANTPSGRWGRVKRGIGRLLGHGTPDDPGAIGSNERDGLPPGYMQAGGFTLPVPRVPSMPAQVAQQSPMQQQQPYSGMPGTTPPIMPSSGRPGTGWDERIPAGYPPAPGRVPIGPERVDESNILHPRPTGPTPQYPQQRQQPQQQRGIGSMLGQAAEPSRDPNADTYVYEGAGGVRGRLPNAQGRARVAMDQKIAEETAVTNARDRIQSQSDEAAIQSLIDAGMDPNVARAKVLNKVVRYDETFGQGKTGGRGGNAMSQADRLEIQDRLDKRAAQTRQLQLQLAGIRSGDSGQRMKIQQQLAQMRAEQAADIAVLHSQQSEANVTESEAARIAADPVASNTPSGKATIADARARADEARRQAAAARGKVAAGPSGPAGKPDAATRAKQLNTQGKSRQDIYNIMKSEGYDVQPPKRR